MGFGLLLIGYFLAFATSLARAYFFADIFGGALIVYALTKLSAFSEKFKNTIPSAMLFTGISAVAAILSLFRLDTVMLFVSTFRAASILILHVYMFTSLEDMAKGADDLRLASRTRRDLAIVTVYYIFYMIMTALGGFMDKTLSGYLSVILYFYGIVTIILNLLLIHSAYCRLYIEGTAERYAELPQFKESRIPFIAKIQRMYYDSKKKVLEEDKKLMKEYREYVAANRDKIPSKKNKKKR